MKLEDLRKIAEARHRSYDEFETFRDTISKHIFALLDVVEAAKNPDLIDYGFTGEHSPEAMENLREALKKLEEL